MGALTEIEEALDKGKKNAVSVSKAVSRKLEFLGHYMRELADLLDPAGKKKEVKKDDKSTTEKAGDDDEIEMDDVEAFLLRTVTPKLEKAVADTINKLRGRLDEDSE
jgi:hypothetical protein